MDICSLQDDDGFSLVEALIAAAVLGTAVVSLAQLLVFTATATTAAGRTTRAALLASEKLEELHASSADVVGIIGTDMPEPGFTREWTAVALPADPVNLALVEAWVRTAGAETRMRAVQPRTGR